MVSDDRIGEVSWGQVFTLYSISHKEPQLNVLRKKVASDKLFPNVVFINR